MPIIHYPGYITKEELARRSGVQLRAINDRIRKKIIPGPIFIDGFAFMKDNADKTTAPAGISFNLLQAVTKFAKKHKVLPEHIFTLIVMGKISAVVVANRVFVIANEPALLAWVQSRDKD